jgi:hypothetical protein
MVLRLLLTCPKMLRLRLYLWLIVALTALAVPSAAYQKPERAAEVNNLRPGENVLWSDPGDVASLDFVNGAGGVDGQPQTPFQFVEEDMAGTNPKIKVRDGKGRSWSVKFGEEAKPSVMATRLAWACGYNVETEYLIAHGRIEGAHGLKRAASDVQGDGSFTYARFQLRADSPKYLSASNWAWSSNPFLGSTQLNGLKIVTMLVSNWDTKDARDRDTSANSATADSNLGIFQASGDSAPRYLYLITDWGASFGRWGSAPGLRNKFDCRAYSNQTPQFVTGARNGIVQWGYSGKHNSDITANIRTSDVEWLLQFLGRITDEQLRRGLAASGSSPEQMECFVQSIRARIGQLQALPRGVR